MLPQKEIEVLEIGNENGARYFVCLFGNVCHDFGAIMENLRV